MEPVDPQGAKRGLKAAKEPLSLRFLLAFSASTVLTAAVAVPMAFQAHLAHEEQPARRVERPAVLGTTTVPDDSPRASAAGLVHAETPEGPRASLQGAELHAGSHLFLELPDVTRVDFVVDDGPVHSDHEHPWQPATGDLPSLDLPPGEHTLTATVTFDDGDVGVRQATFTVVEG